MDDKKLSKILKRNLKLMALAMSATGMPITPEKVHEFVEQNLKFRQTANGSGQPPELPDVPSSMGNYQIPLASKVGGSNILQYDAQRKETEDGPKIIIYDAQGNEVAEIKYKGK
jgi:hypothetical protein